MYVLGINSYLHESSAALIKDGRIVFAAEEERFSRIKMDAHFPKLAVQAALDHVGIELKDLDAIGFGWNKGGVTPLHTLRCTLSGQLPLSMRYIGDAILTAGREIYNGNGLRPLERTFGPVDRSKVFHIDHHEAHAWSSYALSGFDEALVLVLDGRGAHQSTTLYHAKGDSMKPVLVFQYPNSLGSFYESFTDLLGFERHNDEWKVMGLAAYGEPTEDLSTVLKVLPRGYKLDAHLACGSWWNDLRPMIKRFGPRGNPEVNITDADRNLAASVQHALEQALFTVVKEGVRLTGCRNLCLAGGVAMNSKANGRVLASGLVDNAFVQPAATDDGTAIGAALAAHRELGVPIPRYRMTDAYLGPEYSDDDIETVLKTYKLKGTFVPDIEAVTANLLAEGNLIGWFQGRMEYGPRALGNRSILADARRPEMKDRVNEVVKFREGWRPFAPSCLAEAAHEYFEGCHDAPFMIFTFDVRPEKRAEIPTVTHADNTARVQTVERESNPRYWKLIHEFANLTGTPVIMNTSFNLRGEPIVCTPKDAIRTFYSSGLDYLALGSFLIAKEAVSRPREDRKLVEALA